MRATLVVPTLNEATSIGHVLDTFRAAAERENPRLFPNDPLDWEMLVVDGPSTDGTAEVARKAGAEVIPELRPGYGRAYQTGFAAAKGEPPTATRRTRSRRSPGSYGGSSMRRSTSSPATD
jgi:glycosyltransferase involved in cell wall biosynthesis